MRESRERELRNELHDLQDHWMKFGLLDRTFGLPGFHMLFRGVEALGVLSLVFMIFTLVGIGLGGLLPLMVFSVIVVVIVVIIIVGIFFLVLAKIKLKIKEARIGEIKAELKHLGVI